MLLFYRLPLQSGLGPIWHSGLLAIWLYCWWSVAVPLEEPVGGGMLRRRCELQGCCYRLALNSKKVSSAVQTRPLALAGVLPLHRNPPFPSWTSGCLPHPPDSSAERGCLLWCKPASARRNHNTMYFLLCLLYAGVDASRWSSLTGLKVKRENSGLILFWLCRFTFRFFPKKLESRKG